MSSIQVPTQAYELGNPLAEYKGKGGRIFLNLLLVLFGFVILFVGAAQFFANAAYGALCVAGIGLGVVGLGAFAIFRAINERDLRVIVLSKGLMQTKGGRHTLIRWEEIKEVWQAVTVHKRYGITTHTTHRYTILLRNEEKVLFTDTLKNVEALGKTIQEEVTKLLLPLVAEMLRSGQPVSFGKLVLSPQGLSNGRETIPWNQVEKVSLNQGIITVKKAGKWLNWSTVTVAQTPNIFVFLALVDRIVGIKR